ncbi:MAG: HAD family hydrolase [Candidatus Bathyarchaeia archaeon]
MKPIRAVLFDIGGTLILTEEALTKAISDALAANGLQSHSKEHLIENLGLTEGALFEKIAPQDKFQVCLRTFQSSFPHRYLDMLRLVPGVQETFETLRQRRLGVGAVTGFTLHTAEAILGHFRLGSQLDVLVTAEDAQPRPNPDPILAALKRLRKVIGDIIPSETVYVGDTVNDIRSGKAAGAVTVAVLTGAQPRSALEAEKPDYILASVKDLPSLIAEGSS